MPDNKQVVRRMFTDIINDGKLELIDELFDPDFTSETPQGPLDRDGFKEYVAAWRSGFPDIHCEVDDLIEDGDQVAWSVRATGTHTGDFMGIPATGRTVDFDSLNIGRFRERSRLPTQGPHERHQDDDSTRRHARTAPLTTVESRVPQRTMAA